MKLQDSQIKYADLIGDWLLEMGYTHCFFVAGGGCMHLIDGFPHELEDISVKAWSDRLNDFFISIYENGHGASVPACGLNIPFLPFEITFFEKTCALSRLVYI